MKEEWTAPTLTEIRSLSLSELAARWQCSERTVRTLVRAKILQSFPVSGKLILIPMETIEAYEELKRKCNRGINA